MSSSSSSSSPSSSASVWTPGPGLRWADQVQFFAWTQAEEGDREGLLWHPSRPQFPSPLSLDYEREIFLRLANIEAERKLSFDEESIRGLIRVRLEAVDADLPGNVLPLSFRHIQRMNLLLAPPDHFLGGSDNGSEDEDDIKSEVVEERLIGTMFVTADRGSEAEDRPMSSVSPQGSLREGALLPPHMVLCARPSVSYAPQSKRSERQATSSGSSSEAVIESSGPSSRESTPTPSSKAPAKDTHADSRQSSGKVKRKASAALLITPKRSKGKGRMLEEVDELDDTDDLAEGMRQSRLHEERESRAALQSTGAGPSQQSPLTPIRRPTLRNPDTTPSKRGNRKEAYETAKLEGAKRKRGHYRCTRCIVDRFPCVIKPGSKPVKCTRCKNGSCSLKPDPVVHDRVIEARRLGTDLNSLLVVGSEAHLVLTQLLQSLFLPAHALGDQDWPWKGMEDRERYKDPPSDDEV